MAGITETVAIARPPAQVWAVLADFGTISRWAPRVDHSCLTTHRAEGVGTERRVQVGRNAFLEQVVGWEPDRLVAYRIRGLPPLVRSVTNTWRLERSGEVTTVSLTTHVDAGPRPPQQLAARAVSRMLGRTSREMLAGLETHLEATR